MRWRLALLAALALYAATRLAASQPAYASQLFEVHEHAGAGSEYAAAVASTLEEAYAAFKGSGVALAPPCSGPRYAVHVVEPAGGEGGLVRWNLTGEGGLVEKACVVWVNITKGLDARHFTARKPGSYALRVRGGYAGQVNETLVTVYAVPEALYRRAL